ncbi:MAG: class I SAM-dependent methyltransferase [Terriglobales bacterium]
MTLRERIEQEISQRGPIPFSCYMELCLYEPGLGYYAQRKEQFGKAGDFYTSSDVHAVFGRLMARQFEEMWRALGSPEPIKIVELGPGRGLFARDVLDWSRQKFPDFFRALHYTLVETSAALREKMTTTLGEYVAVGRASIAGDVASYVSTENVIVFANEFFDALPVEVLSNHGVMRVGWEAGRFVESFVSASAAEMEYIDRYSIHPEEGERVEAGLEAERWMPRIAAAVPRGFVVIIDYGYTREELLAGRYRGTIMCYRQHSASDNPYEAPGEQDITAHVNFTALRASGEQAGLECLSLVTQAQFLMGIGEETQFSDAFEDARLPQERAKRALQLKHLVTPAGMGETFHVLVMAKGVEKEKAAGLSGLRFRRET